MFVRLSVVLAFFAECINRTYAVLFLLNVFFLLCSWYYPFVRLKLQDLLSIRALCNLLYFALNDVFNDFMHLWKMPMVKFFTYFTNLIFFIAFSFFVWLFESRKQWSSKSLCHTLFFKYHKLFYYYGPSVRPTKSSVFMKSYLVYLGI